MAPSREWRPPDSSRATPPATRPRSISGAARATHTRPHRGPENRDERPCTRSRNRSGHAGGDRKSTRLNSSHVKISYAVFCLKKKKKKKKKKKQKKKQTKKKT